MTTSPKRIISCPEEESLKRQDVQESRVTWDRTSEFVLSVAGYNVGLGNVWRFSYLCYKNGGGAFLVPYLLVAAFCGLPLLFQEVAFGQFTGKGGIEAWNAVPMMKGIGYSGLLVCFYFLGYFTFVMAWCVFYFVHSLTLDTMLWSTCDNWWNTAACVTRNDSDWSGNSSANFTMPINATTPTDEFWDHYVLQKTGGLGTLGSLKNWRMALCYLFSWVVCYLCIIRGIKTTGKVAYVTVTIPYILMIALLIRGVTLDGALTGITYYVTPDLARLAEPTVWLDGASQVFYTLGICIGVLYGFGRHNKRTTDCYRTSYYSVIICCASSIFFGFTIFSFVGHLAHVTGKNVTDVVEGGPGLVFQVYPAALSMLPLPQLWSAVFFLVIIFLAVDSQFTAVEGCLSLLDGVLPAVFTGKNKYRGRTLLCFVLMLTGIPLLFDGGIYIFELLNNYASSGMCILWVAFFQSVTVGWIYGVDRFYEDVKSMIGYYPHAVFKYCYKYITPSITMAIFVFLCAKYTPLRTGKYVYPWWGNLIGWILSASVICCIPVCAIVYFCLGKGTWNQKWIRATTVRRKKKSIFVLEHLPECDEADKGMI